MERDASMSSGRVKDSLESACTAACDDGTSQTGLHMDNDESMSYESKSEQKPTLSDCDNEDDERAVKKRRLDVMNAHSNEHVTTSVKEPTLDIEDGTTTTKEVKIEIVSSDEDESESVKNARLESGPGEGSESVAGGDCGSDAKKPRLQSQYTQSAAVAGRSDRHRNKSTSAAVLLGLVKSRVRKLATERHETAAKTSSSDTPLSSSSSETTLTATSSLSATSSPKMKTSRGECLSS